MGHLPESIHLHADAAELSPMRDFVAGWAERTGLREDDTFAACLVATEAVTNAIRHGRAEDDGHRPITLTCTLEGSELVIEVTDRGRFRADRDVEDTGGRGLFLIRELTRGFELRAGHAGTRLRMRLAERDRDLAASRAA